MAASKKIPCVFLSPEGQVCTRPAEFGHWMSVDIQYLQHGCRYQLCLPLSSVHSAPRLKTLNAVLAGYGVNRLRFYIMVLYDFLLAKLGNVAVKAT